MPIHLGIASLSPRHPAEFPARRRSRERLRVRVGRALGGVGAVVVAACSNGLGPSSALPAQSTAADRPAGSISVVNTTSDSIGCLAWDRESAALIDVKSRVAVKHLKGVAAPSDSGVLLLADISGYRPGADARLFVYRVVGSEGVLRGYVSVPAAQLSAQPARIVVSDSALAASSR